MPELVVRKRDKLTALVDPADYRVLSNAGLSFAPVKKHGTQVIEVTRFQNGKRLFRSLLHRYVLGVDDRSIFVKARNGDYLDCRRDNLVTVSRSEQTAKNPTRTGKYPTGVAATQYGKYAASITVRGVTYHLGVYQTPEEASDAYQRALYETYYGEVSPIPCGAAARFIATDAKAFIDYCEKYFI